VRAVLFDFGGVLTSSPFEGLAAYEAEAGLPAGFIRRLNAANPHSGAWARHERGKIGLDEFCSAFEEEARRAGGQLDAREVLARLRGALRPKMLEAARRCHERLATGLLTNGPAPLAEGQAAGVLGHFDVVVESCRVGLRKPEPAFYELACSLLSVDPAQAAFLDDLGVNLKPAAAMGMRTIKVVDPDAAIAELEELVGFPLG